MERSIGTAYGLHYRGICLTCLYENSIEQQWIDHFKWQKANPGANLPKNKKEVDPDAPILPKFAKTKWTESHKGQQKHCGWDDEALITFNNYIRVSEAARKNDKSKPLEEAILAKLQKDKASLLPKPAKKAKVARGPEVMTFTLSIPIVLATIPLLLPPSRAERRTSVSNAL